MRFPSFLRLAGCIVAPALLAGAATADAPTCPTGTALPPGFELSVTDQQSGTEVTRGAVRHGEACHWYAETETENAQYEVAIRLPSNHRLVNLSTPLQVTPGERQEAGGQIRLKVNISPTVSGPLVFRVVHEDTTSQAALREGTKTTELPLYFARKPVVRLRRELPSCPGVDLCLFRAQTNEVQLEGSNLFMLASGSATLDGKKFPIAGQTLIIPSAQVPTDRSGSLQLTFDTRADLPLYHVATGTALRNVTSEPATYTTTDAPSPRVTLETFGEPLPLFVNENLRVRVKLEGTGQALIPVATYVLEEGAAGARRTVALLTVTQPATLTSAGATAGAGNLLGVAATQRSRRVGTAGGTEVGIRLSNASEPTFFTNLWVAEHPRVQRVSVIRSDHVRYDQPSVSPGEEVRVVATGTGLGRYDRVEPLENALSVFAVVPTETELSFGLALPPLASSRIGDRVHVRLEGQNVADTVIALDVRPPARPRPLDFIDVRFTARGANEQARIGSYDPQRNRRVRGNQLVFHGDRIDGPGGMHGIQYLTLQARLYDREGRLLRERERDLVVSPPGEMYKNAGGGADSLVVDLDHFMEGATRRAGGGASMEVTVRHNPAQYQLGTYRSTVTFRDRKGYSIDPVLGLPTGMIALYRERNAVLRSDSTATGRSWTYDPIGVIAAASVEYSEIEEDGDKGPFRAQVGFAWLNSPLREADDDSRNGDRDFAFSLAYPWELFDLDGKVSFSIAVGAAYLYRGDRWLMVLRPGFEIKT